VQFVDFSSKLLSKTHQIYKSVDGSFSENVQIKAITADLLRLSSRLRSSIPLAHSGDLSTDQQSLAIICSGCQDMVTVLLEKLQKLSVHDKRKKWKSFWYALRSVWDDSEIDALVQRLAEYRNELELHILVSSILDGNI